MKIKSECQGKAKENQGQPIDNQAKPRKTKENQGKPSLNRSDPSPETAAAMKNQGGCF